MKLKTLKEPTTCKKMSDYVQCNVLATKAIFVNNGQAGSYRAICDHHIKAVRERKGRL